MQLSAVLLTIGLPAIDESLDKLLVAMETFPNVAVLGDAVGLARIIGLLLALCVGSYECWMMMLGRRGMDVPCRCPARDLKARARRWRRPRTRRWPPSS